MTSLVPLEGKGNPKGKLEAWSTTQRACLLLAREMVPIWLREHFCWLRLQASGKDHVRRHVYSIAGKWFPSGCGSVFVPCDRTPVEAVAYESGVSVVLRTSALLLQYP